jgi:hypothetical protein
VHGTGLTVVLSEGGIKEVDTYKEDVSIQKAGEEAIRNSKLLTLSSLPVKNVASIFAFVGEPQVAVVNKDSNFVCKYQKSQTQKSAPTSKTSESENGNCISYLLSKIWKCVVDAFKALGNFICCRTNADPKIVYEKTYTTGGVLYEVPKMDFQVIKTTEKVEPFNATVPTVTAKRKEEVRV